MPPGGHRLVVVVVGLVTAAASTWHRLKINKYSFQRQQINILDTHVGIKARGDGTGKFVQLAIIYSQLKSKSMSSSYTIKVTP